MPNVAVVVLDTLRQDAFERAFDWVPGRRFERTYSTSHWTVPAHASLYTGKYASEVGVHGKSPDMDCPEPTLPEVLDDAGYRTRCFTANPQMVIYDGWERGFDQFVGYESLPAFADDAFDWGGCFADLEVSGYRRHPTAVLRCLRSDCATIESLRQGWDLFTRHDVDGGAADTLGRIRATDFGDDEYLFVNLMDAHTPYYPPDDGEPLLVLAAEVLAGKDLDLDRVQRAYATSVDYLSEMYREIYAELAADFEYVLTLSDHGELLGEHGLLNHSYGIYPELIRVPLVVDGPGIEDGTDDTVVSLLDVHATVADLASVDVDSRGQSLFGEHEPRDYAFESHGLLSFHPAQFDRLGVPEAEYAHRDRPLCGLVTPDGDLVYGTHTDGLHVKGDLTDPEAHLEEYFEGIERRGMDRTAGEGADVVRNRLESLGYA